MSCSEKTRSCAGSYGHGDRKRIGRAHKELSNVVLAIAPLFSFPELLPEAPRYHTHSSMRVQIVYHLIREVGLAWIVTELTKDEILSLVAIVILLFTAMVNWNIYSWLLLLAIILVLTAWYFRK